MRRKVILAAVLVFGVIPGIWLLAEHIRGRRQLAEAKRRSEALGDVLDLNRLLPPSVAAPSNGMSRLIAAAQRLTDLGSVQPPSSRYVAPGQLIPGSRMDWWPPLDESQVTNTWVDLSARLSRHQETFAELRSALAMPWRRAELRPFQSFVTMRLTHLSSLKSAVTALGTAAAVAARRGDFEAALADLEAMRIIESDLAAEPILISQLVRIALGSIINAQGWSVLHAQDWDEAQLARLQRVFAPSTSLEDLVRSLEGERAGMLQEIGIMTSEELVSVWKDDWMTRAFGGGPAPLQVPGSAEEAEEVARTLLDRLDRAMLTYVVVPVWRFGWGDQAAAYYLKCADAMIDANRQAVVQRSFARVKEFDLQGLLGNPSGYLGLRAVFARSSLETLDRASSKAFRLETERAIHETAVALRRFQKHHHQLPQALQELVPAFLAAVPMDRMVGQPLRFRRDTETTFTLWSVGEDLKDDGGNANLPRDLASHPNPQWWLAPDAVWPRLASDAQIAQWHRMEAEKIAGKSRGGGTTNRFSIPESLMKRYGLSMPGAKAATNPAQSGEPSGR